MLKIPPFIRAGLCLAFVFLPLAGMDQWFYDHFFRLRGTLRGNSPFVLLRVPDSLLFPLPALVSPSPASRISTPLRTRPITTWHSETYDELVPRLRAAGASLVVFTAFYEQADRQNQPVLRGTDLIFASLIDEENRVVPPLRALCLDNAFGYANLFPDADNLVRRAPAVYSGAASLALQTYHRMNTAPIERNLVEPFLIDFRGPRGTYPAYEALDVLADRISAGAFRGKVVLIGKDDSPASYLETPFGKMSRLEIQANAIDTLASRRYIQPVGAWANRVFSAAVVAISVAIILSFPVTLGWVLLLVLALVGAVGALLLFAEIKYWPGLANPLFCIFGTHLLMLGHKLSKQEEQQWKLQREAEYLKDLDQFKNNFISLFSHDLKTPIARIKAITDRVATEHRDLPGAVVEALRGIDRASSELARLISDILKVTKMESMAIEPARGVVDLNRLVESAACRLRYLADEKGISLVQDLEPLFSMEGDQQLLQEVVTNLVENAIKYSRQGTEVVIRTREEDGRVRVAVSDQGIGIPADEVPRVTGKFYRGREVVESTKGSGLGLYLSKYFIELHQGGLDIASRVGQGTEVSFWLPISA